MNIEERVMKITQNFFPGAKKTHRFIEDLGADSLAILEYVMGLEDEFNINIPENKIKDVVLVSDIIKMLTEHCDQANEECE